SLPRLRLRKASVVSIRSSAALLVAVLAYAGVRCAGLPTAVPFLQRPTDVVIYANDFNGPAGTTYPEWSAATYSWTSNRAGTIAAGAATETVTNIDSTNGTERFLGELGGPIILNTPPYDRDHFVRVDESIVLSLVKLPSHALMTVSFDLYILKSWDGDSPTFGPDRWRVGLAGNPLLLDTTFSNNFQIATDGSVQGYSS